MTVWQVTTKKPIQINLNISEAELNVLTIALTNNIVNTPGIKKLQAKLLREFCELEIEIEGNS